MEPVYLVSNLHRSGSSMLMHCLSKGGLTPIYNKFVDGMNFSAPNSYVPNVNGFYQYTGDVDNFFYDKYKSKLLKCPLKKLTDLPTGKYKLVFIKRDPEEIRKSMHKWTPYNSWGQEEILTFFYNEFVDTILNKLKERDDFEITILNYRDIIKNPTTEFSKLKKLGWPIDVVECSSHVNSQLYRSKI